ncbi:MAG: trimethylamine methyltransferase family protein, partial [Anaerolineales bacterium]|nr:trimethylamine methyltransferase family protein [Anaerolineales bacterium]
MSSDRRKRRVNRRDRYQIDPETAVVAKITQPINTLPPYELLNDEGLEKIHNASLEILSDVGIDFYDDEAQAILKQHGVRLEG